MLALGYALLIKPGAPGKPGRPIVKPTPRDHSRVNRDIARHDRRMAGRRTCNRVRHTNGARMIGTACGVTIAGILVTSTARADRYL